jgi:NADPH2:quinone reductase
MTAMMLAGVASEEGLAVREIARPAPGPGQILVKVAAAGLNRADLNAAKGAGVASKSALGKPIGMEWSGTVEELGSGVSGIAVGDVVVCSGTGGYAEYAIADAGRALPITKADPIAAAGLPLVLMTAHNALVTEGRFTRGQTVLVHGASSGVGIATLKIARLLGASQVIGTSTNADKRTKLKDFGADFIVDPGEPNWSRQILDATEGKGADVVVDMVTGPSINEMMLATALHGHIVNVGRLGGASVDFNLDLHALRRLNFVGVTFRSRTIEEIRAIAAGVRQDLWAHVEDGSLTLPVDRSFALSEAIEAHAYMAANRHLGKILLRL